MQIRNPDSARFEIPLESKRFTCVAPFYSSTGTGRSGIMASSVTTQS